MRRLTKTRRRLTACAVVHALFAAGNARSAGRVFIDIAGSAHLFKGEAALIKDLRPALSVRAARARAAVADTPGCAWAVSRSAGMTIVPPGRAVEVLGGLPVAALRLPDRDIAGASAMSGSSVSRSSRRSRALPCRRAFRAIFCCASIRRLARR